MRRSGIIRHLTGSTGGMVLLCAIAIAPSNASGEDLPYAVRAYRGCVSTCRQVVGDVAPALVECIRGCSTIAALPDEDAIVNPLRRADEDDLLSSPNDWLLEE